VNCTCTCRHVAAGKRRLAFTLVELLVVIAIIGILIALLLPAVQAAREAARRSQCTNNLKQAGLGLHNYESAYNSFPFRMGGTGTTADTATVSNQSRASGWVPLLPFMEQAPLYDAIKSGGTANSATSAATPAWGSSPNSVTPDFIPWRTQVPGLLCPSDPKTTKEGDNYAGKSNYVFSMGDTIRIGGTASNNYTGTAKHRGLFWYQSGVRLRDITDGTSNTIAASERSIGADSYNNIKGAAAVLSGIADTMLSTCLATKSSDGKYSTSYTLNYHPGRRWADGAPIFAGFTTVLPPTASSCVSSNGADAYGVFSPTSWHPGGVNGLMADGSCRFFSETIDTGSAASNGTEVTTGVSNYGVWGALGSKDGGESTSDF